MIYIANIRLPTEKAHGLQIMKMCEAFARAGHTVELVVPMRFNAMKEDPFVFYDVEPIFAIRRIFSLDFVRFGKFGFWIQSLSFVLRALLLAHAKTDLFYSRDPLVAYVFSLVGRKVIFEVHTKSLTPLTKGALMRAQQVICITRGLKDLYVKEYGIPESKMLVEPDATDPRYFNEPLDRAAERAQLRIPPGVQVVGYVGGMTTMGRDKGVEEIVGAVAHTNAHLLFYGVTGQGKVALAELLEKHGMKNRSVIVDDISQKRMAVYMRISDMLIMNYPSAEHYRLYMSPLKMFSYMASGVPIVSTDLPSIREVLNDESAFLVPPDDEESLARGITEALTDTTLAAAKARAAKELVATHSWEKRARRILSFIWR